MDLTSSKTLQMWLVIFAIAFLAVVFATVVALAFGREVPFLSEFFNLLGIGGGGATARNVISDGIMPRVPQAIGANRDAQVSLQSPVSMSLATDVAARAAATPDTLVPPSPY